MKNSTFGDVFNESEFTSNDVECVNVEDFLTFKSYFRKSAVVGVHTYIGDGGQTDRKLKGLNVLLLSNGDTQTVLSTMDMTALMRHIYEDNKFIGPYVNISFGTSFNQKLPFHLTGKWVTTIRDDAVDSIYDDLNDECNDIVRPFISQFTFTRIRIMPGKFLYDMIGVPNCQQ